MARRHLRFALPPSRGNRFQANGPKLLELFLEEPLAPDVCALVHSCPDYASLGQELLAGQSEIAWAPPLLCARVEQAGGVVVGRFQRKGLTTYRAALVCAKARPVDLASTDGLRAIWVDAESTSGYLLPRAYLLQRGIDPATAFASESFSKTYAAALEAVAQGRADLTAVYATPARAQQARTGLEDVPLAVRERLQAFAFTEEAPNDGLALCPTLPDDLAQAVCRLLLAALRRASAGYVLAQTFNAETLETAPRGGYDALLRLAPSR
jgi:phosphonate transport system substrate-binding protein